MSKFHNPIYEKDRWAANRSKAFLIAVLSVNSDYCYSNSCIHEHGKLHKDEQ